MKRFIPTSKIRIYSTRAARFHTAWTHDRRPDRCQRFPKAAIRWASGSFGSGWKAGFLLGYNPVVELPDLLPDFSFPRLGNIANDIDFAFQAKCYALGPHIAARWGWDEAFQRKVHEQRYDAKPFFAIQHMDRRVGTISIEIWPTHMRLGEFYLLPSFQWRGIGTAVLRHFIALEHFP